MTRLENIILAMHKPKKVVFFSFNMTMGGNIYYIYVVMIQIFHSAFFHLNGEFLYGEQGR